MIIWGTYTTKKIVQSGQFYCPHCEQHRAYDLRRPKKWGHLYWIPIIPMEEFDRYVECKSCAKTWSEKVLGFDPLKENEERKGRLSILTAQLMALVSGENGLSMTLARKIAIATERLVGEALSPQLAFAAISESEGPASILRKAKNAANDLTDRGRELMLASVITASPKVPLGPRERSLIVDIGHHLGMSSAHIKGLLAEMESG